MSLPTRRTLTLVLLALGAGAAMRIWFIHALAQVNGDGLVYGAIAANWLTRGVYGYEPAVVGGRVIAPTLIRLPGYPLFLAVCFRIFGLRNYRAVFYVQALVDLAGCLFLAGFVRRIHSRRAAAAALLLATLCPFTANYVAMPLTETLSVFCVALGFYAFALVLERPRWPALLLLALACSYAALLRPDGALLGVTLFAALAVYGRRSLGLSRALRMAAVAGLISLLPFVPWAYRNWRDFHVFQPLAPRYATDPNELSTPGFERWTKTWMADFASTYEIYWNVPGGPLNIDALPPRAFDNSSQYVQTKQLFSAYNLRQRLNRTIDDGFDVLASARIRAHPLRYYAELPVVRLSDMWLRPRVEMLNIELRWWQYSLHPSETCIALAYGALNLLYLIAATAGAFFRPRFAGAMVGYLAIRSALLLTLEAPEPRYTLEGLPLVLVFASVFASAAFFAKSDRTRGKLAHSDRSPPPA